MEDTAKLTTKFTDAIAIVDPSAGTVTISLQTCSGTADLGQTCSVPLQTLVPPVKGSVVMTVSDPATFVADPLAKKVMECYIATLAQVLCDAVSVLLTVVRRLSSSAAEDGAELRRLAGGVKVTYTIRVPASSGQPLASIAQKAKDIAKTMRSKAPEDIVAVVAAEAETATGMTVVDGKWVNADGTAAEFEKGTKTELPSPKSAEVTVPPSAKLEDYGIVSGAERVRGGLVVSLALLAALLLLLAQ